MKNFGEITKRYPNPLIKDTCFRSKIPVFVKKRYPFPLVLLTEFGEKLKKMTEKRKNRKKDTHFRSKIPISVSFKNERVFIGMERV